MWDDPIVEETRRLRDEYAARFGGDLDAMVEDLRKRQAEHPERVVSYARPSHEDDLPPGEE